MFPIAPEPRLTLAASQVNDIDASGAITQIDGRLLAFIWLLLDYTKSKKKKKTETKREKV